MGSKLHLAFLQELTYENAIPKVHMKVQGTQKSQYNREKKEHSWRAHTFLTSNCVQSSSDQDCMTLA